MAENKQISIKSRAARTRGSRGKKRGNKQPSTTATTSPSPSRSPSPLPAVKDTSRSTVLAPVLDLQCRCHKRSPYNTSTTQSSYTNASTQTFESSFTAPTSDTVSSVAFSSLCSPTSTAASSSTPSTPASPLPRRSSDTFSVLLDLPLTTAELRDWEQGIKAARSPAKRSKWSKMLQEEIRQRGIEGLGGEMTELVLKQYYM